MRVAILSAAVGGESEPEEVVGGGDGVTQGVDVGLVVVDVQRRPGGGGHAELAHQRLGAVVAGPDADAVLVEHLGEVMGVEVAEGEGQHAAPLGRHAGTVDGELGAEALRERPEGVGGEGDLVLADSLHAEPGQVVDRRSDADEAAEEMERASRPGHAPQLVVMTPELFVLAGKPAAEIGTELNAWRRRILRRVLTDGPLLGLAGPNGFVRYAGCATALAAGRSMEGEMSLSFAIRYVLRPVEMED